MPRVRTFEKTGKISPASTAMIAMTTSNSMSVNAAGEDLVEGFIGEKCGVVPVGEYELTIVIVA